MNAVRKKGIEKAINIILNIFIIMFGIVLLVTIYSSVQTKILGKSYSDFFGYSLFEVQTGSMSDKINPGDWIIVKTSRNYKLNDIITYKYNNEFITHRIIEAYNNTYVTKGDANNAKDNPINKDQVVGRVSKILPGFGIFKKTIFNPIILIAIITTIILFNFAFKNNNKTLKKQSKVLEKLNKEINFVRTKKLKKESIKPTELVELPVIEEPTVVEEEPLKEEFDSYVPVDLSEIDKTFLEIAENEIEEPKPEEKVSLSVEENDKEVPNRINLELLENTKKSKNIIDKIMAIKIEELNELLEIIDDDGKTYVNEPTIKNKIMSIYIDARYYNYYGEIEDNSKKISLKIEKLLKEKTSDIINDYKGNDQKYKDKVNRFIAMFILLSNLEQAKDMITDTKAQNEYYKKELVKYAKQENWNNQKIKTVMTNIMKIQRNYVGIIDYFYKKLETNMFEMNLNKITGKKNMYAVCLNHNIYFSKVYSDYIIDKTYSEGVVAEDKLVVLLTLLSVKLTKNMISSNFDKKYFIYIPRSLYSKEKKFEKTLKMINDEYAKESIVLLIKFEDLVKKVTLIKKSRKNGYKYAVVFDRETKIEEKHYSSMYLADYIFVDKKVVNVVKMLSTIPEDLVDKIIYENISEKIGDFGGE